MAEPILSDNMEKAPTESNLSITSNDINIELSKEFLVELRKNIYHGTYNEDVVDHIAKVLKMVDLIYVPGVDSHQLRMKVFPLSLADDAKEWWISEEITTWEELVEKFFYRFYLESYDKEDEMLDEGENWGIDPFEFLSNIITSFKNHKKVDGRTQKESKYENPSNTATDSFFKAYDVCDMEKESGHGQMKRKDNDKDDKRPHKKICKTEKFEANVFIQLINMAYPLPLDTAYQSSRTESKSESSYLTFVLIFFSFFRANPADMFTLVTGRTYQS
ncbi:hypothetical protein Tco_0115841 [Tanacetum coccineum]